jgi:tRNA G18 (ribose-2'-O)-methylase SpoU
VGGAIALCQARFDVNLGVAMRSAEAAGLSEVFVIGTRSGSLSSARGAEHALPITWFTDPYELIIEARHRGYQLVAIQQTPDSQPYHQADYPPRPLFVLGSEDAGLPDELRIAADLIVEIPLYGAIDSLNVATAATCVVMHWRAHLDIAQ